MPGWRKRQVMGDLELEGPDVPVSVPKEKGNSVASPVLILALGLGGLYVANRWYSAQLPKAKPAVPPAGGKAVPATPAPPMVVVPPIGTATPPIGVPPISDFGDPFTYEPVGDGTYYRLTTASARSLFFKDLIDGFVGYPVRTSGSASRAGIDGQGHAELEALSTIICDSRQECLQMPTGSAGQQIQMLDDFLKGYAGTPIYVLATSRSLLGVKGMVVVLTVNPADPNATRLLAMKMSRQVPDFSGITMSNGLQFDPNASDENQFIVVATPETGIPELGMLPTPTVPTVGFIPIPTWAYNMTGRGMLPPPRIPPIMPNVRR
jgi:hypothetical protein